MDIGTLVTTLKLDSNKFSADLKASGKNINSFAAKSNRSLAKAQKKWGDFRKSIKSIGTIALGVAAAGGGLYYLTKKTLDYADTIAKTADKIGLSTNALQEYRYIADRAGVATSMMDNGLVAFSKRVGELRQGTGALSTYLKKLDEDFMRQVSSAGSVDEALQMVFARMNQMTDASDRAALGAAAFSRTAGVAMTNMAPSVDDLRKRAHELGIVINEDLLRNSEKTVDSITDLEYILRANLNRTIVNLAPVIGRISDNMTEWTNANDEFIKIDLPDYLENTAAAFETVGSALFKVSNLMIKYTPNLYTISKLLKSIGEDSKNLPYLGENVVRKPMPTDNLKGVITSSASSFDKDKYQKYLDELKEKESDFNFQVRQLDRDTFEQRRQEVYRWAKKYEEAVDKAGLLTNKMKDQIVASGISEIKLINKEKFISDVEAMTDKAEMFADTFKDSLVDLVTQGEINFKSIANSFAAMIAEMMVEAEKAKFLEGFKSSASSGNGWISSVGSGIMNMFDSGGWVTEPVVGVGTRSGETYSFAERGAEFVSKNGPGGGGAVMPTINIENQTGSHVTQDNVQFDSERMILSVVLKGANQNMGGFRQGMNQALRG